VLDEAGLRRRVVANEEACEEGNTIVMNPFRAREAPT